GNVSREGCESGDDLAMHAERRRRIGDALLSLGNELLNRSAERLQGVAFGMIELCKVVINISRRHEFMLKHHPTAGGAHLSRGRAVVPPCRCSVYCVFARSLLSEHGLDRPRA